VSFAPGTHCVGGCVGPRTGLDDVERRQIFPLQGFELRPLVRPACSYSDCPIPAPESEQYLLYSGMGRRVVRYKLTNFLKKRTGSIFMVKT
jgi:hypothetical protein